MRLDSVFLCPPLLLKFLSTRFSANTGQTIDNKGAQLINAIFIKKHNPVVGGITFNEPLGWAFVSCNFIVLIYVTKLFRVFLKNGNPIQTFSFAKGASLHSVFQTAASKDFNKGCETYVT